MYVSVTLRNPIISRATRKRSITCASECHSAAAIAVRGGGGGGETKSSLYNYIIVRDIGDAVRTQRSGGQPEYEPIRSACNRLAQLSIPVHTCCRDSTKVVRD